MTATRMPAAMKKQWDGRGRHCTNALATQTRIPFRRQARVTWVGRQRRAPHSMNASACSRGSVAKRIEWKPYINPADNEYILDELRKAGPPE
jgi:hypothetical protein